MVYDLGICGGGPAGVAAGVYASRKLLSTVFITPSFDSQSTVASDIRNWIGTTSISGQELSENLKKHVLACAGDTVNVREGESVIKISRNKSKAVPPDDSSPGSKTGGNFLITTDIGSYETKTVLIATGSYRRKLEIPGALEFENKGITYCASCDGPLFAGKDVAVIGGGNAGFETASQLLAYAKSVTLFARGNELKADPITVEKVSAHPNMRVVKNAALKRIGGDKFVTSLTYIQTDIHPKTGKQNNGNQNAETATPADIKIPVQGIFVEIGMVPNTGFAEKLIKLNEYGQILVDSRNQTTKTPGVWAAGDCTDGLYHQNNIAAGDAVKALEDIYLYLRT